VSGELVQLPFGGGIDESVDDSRCPPERMRLAQNVVFSGGAVSKRNGFTSMATGLIGGGTLSAIRSLSTFKSVPLTTDADNAYSYVAAAGAWNNVGRASPCMASRSEFAANESPIADVAETNGYRCVAYQRIALAPSASQGAFYATITDATTGALVNQSQVSLAGSYAPAGAQMKVIACGNVFVVIYQNPAQSALYARSFDTTTQTWSAITALSITSGTTLIFDACPIVGSSNFAVIWCDVNTLNIYVQSFSSAFAFVAGPTLIVAAPAAAIPAIRATAGGTAWCAWSPTVAGALRVYAANLNANTLAITQAAWFVRAVASVSAIVDAGFVLGIEPYAGTSSFAKIVYSVAQNAALGLGLAWSNISSVGTASYHSDFMPGWSIVSRPFTGPTGAIYVLALWFQQYQSTQCLLELPASEASHVQALPMATVAVRASYPSPLRLASGASYFPNYGGIGRQNSVTNPGNPSATKFNTICFTLSTTGTIGQQLATFDFNHPAQWQSVELGGATYQAGGAPMAFDGVKTGELGYVTSHPDTSFQSSFAAGSGLYPQVYRYVVVYAQTTATGEVVRSAPNTFAPTVVDITAGTAGPTNQARVVVWPLRATHRQSVATGYTPVTIEIYRTHWDVATSTMSTTYYLCGKIPNDLTVNTITYVDDVATQGINEVNVATGTPLYTTGQVLDSNCPPSLRFLCVHNQRIFGIGDDGLTLWYTTPYVAGEQPRWNDALRISVPPGGGDLVALASQDGKLYAFKKDRGYVIYGDGPSDTGAGADFSIPQELPFGLGCVDPRSIGTMPLGVVLLTAKGLYLLARDGTASWIGDRVQRTLATTPYVTSIDHVESVGHVRFALSSTGQPNASGAVLVWDYRHDTWSTWLVSTTVGGSSCGPFAAATASDGTYYAAIRGASLGAVYFYDATSYLDDGGTWVTLNVLSGWVAPQGQQGLTRLQRIQVLATKKSSHALQLTPYRDYGGADAPYTFSSVEIAALPGREQLSFAPLVRKIEAISVGVTDAAPSGTLGTGQGVVINGLMLVVTPKQLPFNIPSSQNKA